MKIRIIDFKPETAFKAIHEVDYSFDRINHSWYVNLYTNLGGLKEYSHSFNYTHKIEDFLRTWMENIPLSKGYFRTIKRIKA